MKSTKECSSLCAYHLLYSTRTSPLRLPFISSRSVSVSKLSSFFKAASSARIHHFRHPSRMEALKLSKAGAMIMSKIDTKVMSGPLVAQERWRNDITYARAGFVSPSQNEKSFSSKCANGCILLVHYFTKASNRARRNSFTPDSHARWNLPLTKSELLLS